MSKVGVVVYWSARGGDGGRSIARGGVGGWLVVGGGGGG